MLQHVKAILAGEGSIRSMLWKISAFGMSLLILQIVGIAKDYWRWERWLLVSFQDYMMLVILSQLPSCDDCD